jgi:COMM domain containing 4
MKFKFCGNIDCPEWLITEITFLTKISTIKLRIICNNLINSLLNDYKNLKDIQKSLEEMNFSDEEATIIISVIEFIIKNSAKFDVEDLILNQELQQLGLPQENADSISKVFKNQKENLRKKMRNDVFKFNKIESIDYKINYILASKSSGYELNVVESDDLIYGEQQENYKIKNLETKINFNFNLAKGEVYQISTNKEILGKLINDLEKCSEAIKKFKSN